VTAEAHDAYAVCRHVKRYTQKNGYAPKRHELGVPEEFIELLEKNEVVKIVPLAPNGPPIVVLLTDKGYRMAEAQR